MIVEYHNEGQRALSSCRLGIDVFEKCTDVNNIYFTVDYDRGPVPNVEVTVASSITGRDGNRTWTQFIAKGTLEVWFTERGTALYMYTD